MFGNNRGEDYPASQIMNRKVHMGWFWLVVGGLLFAYFLDFGISSHGRTIWAPYDTILLISGSLMLALCGIAKIRQRMK